MKCTMNNKLTAKQVEKLQTPKLHPIGDGLYLKITPTGIKSWVHRYQLNGKRRAMKLGVYSEQGMSLAKARVKVASNTILISEGKDPLEIRNLETFEQNKPSKPTFDDCVEGAISKRRDEWKNPKSEAQWRSSLKTYASPLIGGLPVDEITVHHILKVLQPIWNSKTETATRIRSRIEIVLNWAKAMKYRSGDNPAIWRGDLQELLPKPSLIQKIIPHKALPYEEIGNLIKILRTKKSITAKALEFTILTGVRTEDTLKARWEEIDIEKRIWSIEGDRMKGKKSMHKKEDHVVPLSDQAISLIKSIPQTGGWLFPSPQKNKEHLSNNAMLGFLHKQMKCDDTVHGFRSTFRDWVAEETEVDNTVGEMAIAHKIKNKAEASYRRRKLLKRRALLMQSWADYCDGKRSPSLLHVKESY